MESQLAPSQRPRVILTSFKPVSIFLCPCHVDSSRIGELRAQAAASAAQRKQDELLDLHLEPFAEECLGLQVRVQPRLFFLPDLDWVALALVAELSPAQGNYITFEQMLAFNSNFRVCQGKLERQDTPIVSREKLAFALSCAGGAAQVFAKVARQVLGSYRPPDALKRTVTLSMAQFENALNDTDLYAFGTIAHSDEIIDPVWAAAAVRQRAYDRWHSMGIRFFVHSYSLVCGCAAVGNESDQDPTWLFHIFMEDYVRMGARLALERAELLELRSALPEIANLTELRYQRKNWVNSRRVLGVRWTAEGTQRAQIEQVWRQASGLERMSEEIDRRFAQTVDLFEAEAADRLNQLLRWFQIVVTGFGAAGVTAQVTREMGESILVPWTVGMGILAAALSWLGLHFGTRRIRRRRDRPA